MMSAGTAGRPGHLAIPFAERHGGLGADLLTVCLAIEQISRACATSGLILAVQSLAAIPIQVAAARSSRTAGFPGWRPASG